MFLGDGVLSTRLRVLFFTVVVANLNPSTQFSYFDKKLIVQKKHTNTFIFS